MNKQKAHLFSLHLKKNGISATPEEILQIHSKDNVFFWFKGEDSMLTYAEQDTVYFWSVVLRNPGEDYKQALREYLNGLNYKYFCYRYQKKGTETRTDRTELCKKRILKI